MSSSSCYQLEPWQPFKIALFLITSLFLTFTQHFYSYSWHEKLIVEAVFAIVVVKFYRLLVSCCTPHERIPRINFCLQLESKVENPIKLTCWLMRMIPMSFLANNLLRLDSMSPIVVSRKRWFVRRFLRGYKLKYKLLWEPVYIMLVTSYKSYENKILLTTFYTSSRTTEPLLDWSQVHWLEDNVNMTNCKETNNHCIIKILILN